MEIVNCLWMTKTMRQNSSAFRAILLCLPMINQKRRVPVFMKEVPWMVGKCMSVPVVRTIFHTSISISHCADSRRAEREIELFSFCCASTHHASDSENSFVMIDCMLTTKTFRNLSLCEVLWGFVKDKTKGDEFSENFPHLQSSTMKDEMKIFN